LAQLEIIMHKPHPAALAAEACNAISYLADSHQAFEAVERLIAVDRTNPAALTGDYDPAQDLSHIDRHLLSQLLRVLNQDMRTRIAEVEAATHAAHEERRSLGDCRA
jgi:macrodomain Ter protein organizer (MatP/YcbG family)